MPETFEQVEKERDELKNRVAEMEWEKEQEQLEACPNPTHPNKIQYEHGMCIYCHAELTPEEDGVGCDVCCKAIAEGRINPSDKFQFILRDILLHGRWDDQGGDVGYNGDGEWAFVSSSLSVKPEQLNALYEFAGIEPHQIVSAGSCKDCKWSDSKGESRGYAQPCLSCLLPRMSNFEPK